MSVTQDILALVNKVDSQADLKTISNALTSRWRVLQGVTAQKQVAEKGLVHGQPVSFVVKGRRLYGKVRTVNPKTCTVDLVSGGSYRVSPQYLQPEEKFPDPATKRSEREIMLEINEVYCGLSPESLTCDGEAPRAAVQRKSRELNQRLEGLFKELGRRVSEHESFDWWMKNNGRRTSRELP